MIRLIIAICAGFGVYYLIKLSPEYILIPLSSTAFKYETVSVSWHIIASVLIGLLGLTVGKD